MYDPEKERKECEEIFSKMFHKINGADRELLKVFKEKLPTEHRTLQQSFWRMIAELIIQTSEVPEGWYDLRNEGSVIMCKEIVDKVKDKLYLPYV